MRSAPLRLSYSGGLRESRAAQRETTVVRGRPADFLQDVLTVHR
jgi:hypothetical protein